MRRVANIMGIPISIDIPNCQNPELFEMAFTRLHAIDDKFSTYKPGSALNSYRRGQAGLDKEMQRIKKACDAYEGLTNGYFSAYYNGTFDPTGYVKGWSIQEVGDLLKARGITTFLINAAGDIMAASSGKKTWNISLQDPFSRSKTLGAVTLTNGTIATSGTYERGQHIIDPHTKKTAATLVSASVYGKEIITADVLATACIAMGSDKAIDFMNSQDGYEALVIDTHGFVLASHGFGAPKTQTVL